MDEYQEYLVAEFFKPLQNISQISCHQFVLDHIAPIFLPCTAGEVDVQPSPLQGSMSYTAKLRIHSTHANCCMAVQFRSDKQDLSKVSEASRIHGPIVPLITYQGMYEELFVYTSPWAEGTPYISVLTPPDDVEPPLEKKKATVMDLADLVTREARAHTTISDTAMSDLTSTLEDILHKANKYEFRNASLRDSVSACVDKLRPQLRDLAALPVILTHQDLSPFNYLVDVSTGRIKAVLDWESALDLPVGSNFYFMDSLFGFMTRDGWQDSEDRQELETAFYNRALANLAAQGLEAITKGQLESQKAIGILLSDVERLFKDKDVLAEHSLDGHLRGLSFM